MRPDQTLSKSRGPLLPLRVRSHRMQHTNQMQTGSLPGHQGCQPGPIFFLDFCPCPPFCSTAGATSLFFPKVQQAMAKVKDCFIIWTWSFAMWTLWCRRHRDVRQIPALTLPSAVLGYTVKSMQIEEQNSAFAPILHSLVPLGPGVNMHPKHMIQNPFNIYQRKIGIT